jgi:hypothetical protein
MLTRLVLAVLSVASFAAAAPGEGFEARSYATVNCTGAYTVDYGREFGVCTASGSTWYRYGVQGSPTNECAQNEMIACTGFNDELTCTAGSATDDYGVIGRCTPSSTGSSMYACTPATPAPTSGASSESSTLLVAWVSSLGVASMLALA